MYCAAMYARRPLVTRSTAQRARPWAAVCLIASLCAAPAAWAVGNDEGLPAAIPVPPLVPYETIAAPPAAPRDAVPGWSRGALLLGLGLVSAGIGTWSGLQALAHSRAAEPHCATDIYTDVCDPQGIAERNEGRRYTATATIGISASVPFFIFGTWLFVTAPMTWEQRTVAGGAPGPTPTPPAPTVFAVWPGGVVLGQRF